VGFPAVARHVTRTVSQLPAALPPISVHLLCCGGWPWLSGLAGADRRFCDRDAHSHSLLFCVLLLHFIPARLVRENQAGAEFDTTAGRVGFQGAASMNRYNRLALALALAGALCGISVAARAQEADAPPRLHWSFSGPFGLYDSAQLQRGFKIYQEVCSSCHGLKLISFRNLADPGGPGFTEAQAATVAASFQVTDGPNDQGKMFKPPGKIAAYSPPPFANEQAARAALGGKLPPDMSVLAKARGYEWGFPWFVLDAFTMYQEDGPDYIHAILTGYADAPSGFVLPPGGQ